MEMAADRRMTRDAEAGAPANGTQFAALPWRLSGGKPRVLLVTSRGTGRWIVPKGWAMKDLAPWKAAAIEAMEEAGVAGRIAEEPFGTYTYQKLLDDGRSVLCRVKVYPLLVLKTRSSWKEQSERRRAWFRVGKAAKMVEEPELAALLRSLSKKPKKVPVVGPLLKRASR
jgi:8-oxo-dGTP pyrophosphatase MutT (NUDIX family)